MPVAASLPALAPRDSPTTLAELVDHDGQTPRKRLMLTLEHTGFSSERSANELSYELNRCFVIDAARAHPEVVGHTHLETHRGAWVASLDPAALHPFAEPGACPVTLPVPVMLR